MLEQGRHAAARLDESNLVGDPRVRVVHVGAGDEVAGLAHELIRGVFAGRERFGVFAGRTVLAADDVRRFGLLPVDGVGERANLHFELVETRFLGGFVFHCFLLGFVGFLVDVFLVALAGDGGARIGGDSGDGYLQQSDRAAHVHGRIAFHALVRCHRLESHGERIDHAVTDQLHRVAPFGGVADGCGDVQAVGFPGGVRDLADETAVVTAELRACGVAEIAVRRELLGGARPQADALAERHGDALDAGTVALVLA